MSTITYFVDKAVARMDLGGKYGLIENFIDFTAKNCVASDVVQCLKIPAGTLVDQVYVRVATAQGATCTATVGDGDTANGWDASTNLNATAGTQTAGLAGTDAYATAGKVYTAADTIDLVLGHNATAAKVWVAASICRVERYAS